MRMLPAAMCLVTFGLSVSAADPGKAVGAATRAAPRPILPSPHYLEGNPPQYIPEPDGADRQANFIRTILAPDRAAALWLVDQIRFAKAKAQLEMEMRRERTGR